jgi:hypothetical protein
MTNYMPRSCHQSAISYYLTCSARPPHTLSARPIQAPRAASRCRPHPRPSTASHCRTAPGPVLAATVRFHSISHFGRTHAHPPRPQMTNYKPRSCHQSAISYYLTCSDFCPDQALALGVGFRVEGLGVWLKELEP